MRNRIIPAYAGCTIFLLVIYDRSRDHPRIRGVHAQTHTTDCSRAGSSPHTRGALCIPILMRLPVRIIPAYAGCTPCQHNSKASLPDHPRIRGVHGDWWCSRGRGRGSSPHTRGARNVPVQEWALRGIIPAYAGCTCSRTSSGRSDSDHPRIRGVHRAAAWHQGADAGSSPHTRGARVYGAGSADRWGIIPAYAGCTPAARPRAAGRRDHPRIRGVHLYVHSYLLAWCGSSPHTRGAPILYNERATRMRIIPAYAGCTCARVSAPPWMRDHPRIRGVHAVSGRTPDNDPGSSPHTRGAPGEPGKRLEGRRIIPAYAGCTRATRACASSTQDHPRIRGVHASEIGEAITRIGSSPHTRGAPSE